MCSLKFEKKFVQAWDFLAAKCDFLGLKPKGGYAGLKKQWGVTEVLDATPGYRRFATKDGNVIEMKFSRNIGDSAKTTKLDIRKSGGTSLEPVSMSSLGPVLHRSITTTIADGSYFSNALGRQVEGPHILRSDASFQKGCFYFNKMEGKELPRSRWGAYNFNPVARL